MTVRSRHWPWSRTGMRIVGLGWGVYAPGVGSVVVFSLIQHRMVPGSITRWVTVAVRA